MLEITFNAFRIELHNIEINFNVYFIKKKFFFCFSLKLTQLYKKIIKLNKIRIHNCKKIGEKKTNKNKMYIY